MIKRQLTPLGKITVIQSILLPKMTHLFITLLSPSKEWLKQLEKLFSNSFGMEKMIKYQEHYQFRSILMGAPNGTFRFLHQITETVLVQENFTIKR